MPIYEYECQKCGRVIETIHGMNEKYESLFCKNCNKETKMTKLISSTYFKLEGDGWSKSGYQKNSDLVKEAI